MGPRQMPVDSTAMGWNIIVTKLRRTPIVRSCRMDPKGSPALAGSDVAGTCNVCGEKAFYNFYGAMACDSCRTFFRRHVLQHKTLVCEFDGLCRIELQTRRDCAKCRFEKCFQVGMRRELVAPSEDERLRRGRLREHPESTSPDGQPFTFASTSSLADVELLEGPSAQLTAPSDCSTGAEALELSVRAKRSHSTHYLPHHHRQPYVRPSPLLRPFHGHQAPQLVDMFGSATGQLQSEGPMLSSSDALVDVAKSSDSGRSLNIRGLSPTEQNKLTEVMVVAEIMSKRPDESFLTETSHVNKAMRLLYFTTEKLIEATKELRFFMTLSQGDQVTLLRGCASEILLLKSVRSANLDTCNWNINVVQKTGVPGVTFLPIEILKKTKCDEIFEKYVQFARTFDVSWKSDDRFLTLIMVVSLFDPQRANLVAQDSVRLEQQHYVNIVKRYLECLCATREEAESMFGRLRVKLEELRGLSREYEAAQLDVSANDFDLLHRFMFYLSL